MKSRQTGTTRVDFNPVPTKNVRVSDHDDLDVFVVGGGVPIVLVHGALVWSLLKPLAEELAAKGGYR